MVGINYIENFRGGEADLTKAISQLGYNDTPLFNAIRKAVPIKSGQSFEGHAWRYEVAPDGDDSNAHVEGSVPATAQSLDLGDSLNHYQIIKHTYGISGSMEGKTRTDGSLELANEGAGAAIRHRKTIEKMLFGTQSPVKGVKSTNTAGVSGGLDHWCVAENTIGTAGTLTIQLLRELFKIGHLNGVTATHLYVGDGVKDVLDDIFASKVMVGLGATTLEGTNYTLIKNMAYAPNVKIVMSPYVASGEAIAVNHNDLALVYQRLSKSYELSRTSDSINKEIISELTLRVNNPFAVAKMSGIAV